jgi:hypothetical protein
MATVGIQLSIDQAELQGLQAALGEILRPDAKAVILAAALEKAVLPAFLRLKEVTPVGPTGNLRRAATYKVKPYPIQGNAVAVLGYTQANRAASQSAQGGKVQSGPDRAFHQWWLENGLRQRTISTLADKPYTRKAHTRTMKSGKVAEVRQHQVARQGGYIASSFKSLGPFEMSPTPRMPRGSGSGQRVQTRPEYDKAFFKKSSNPIIIPPMPPGGTTGRPPLQTAFNQTQARVAEILQAELRISLEKALDALTYTRTGTAT